MSEPQSRHTLSPQAVHWIEHLDPTQHDDMMLIQNACAFASLHETNETLCGISTLTQGLNMADVLIALRADSTAIAATLLYPAALYQEKLIHSISEKFDRAVVQLIQGAMRMESVHAIHREKNAVTAQQNQIDNLRKMLLSMANDIRTVLLKLAERLFILQHLEKLSPNAQQKIAQDVMDYYAPLANRLGVGQIKWQLEDWAFRYLNPTEYKKISTAFQMKHEDRVKLVHTMITTIKKMLSRLNLQNITVTGRIKHIYSIYRKTHRKNVNVDEIYDTSAIRVLVPTIKDCYAVLSLVHEKWKPISKEFDDYIAKPKPNGYQSIHTAIIHENKTPVEIQIRTTDMHEKAELGIAAHWKYKENKAVHESDEEKIILLRELLDWQKAVATPGTSEKLYQEAFSDRIYVFSPNGDVFDLQKSATPLDFAYLIHTEIGHRCRGAKVNGALVPLTHELKTGDRIDIVTAKEAHPSRDWLRTELGFLKTIGAIRKVRHWFYKQEHEPEVAQTAANIVVDKKIKKTKESGNLASNKIFSVQGTTYLLTQIAQCCKPATGDAVIGYITRGRGISVHKKNCHNILASRKLKPERLIDIAWGKK